MIDLNRLRDNPEKTIELLRYKEPAYNAYLLCEKDKQVRDMRVQVESLRHEKNVLAQEAKKGITPELREQSRELGKKLSMLDEQLKKEEQEFQALYLACPNIPQEDLPVGDKEHNRVIRHGGKERTFGFLPKNHVELGTALGWFNFEVAAKMTGSNFALYQNQAVSLMYALAMFMLEHNAKHGYRFVLPPYLVNEHSLEVSGNFPKFKDQVYTIPEDGLYLSPTAEVNLANMYRDTILTSEELPIRLTAWTSCFRREAGSYGAHERGLIRIHQFEKVEIFTLCEPEKAHEELEHMLACAEGILKELELPYRIMLLATQDCSFASARTYDLEVLMPGQGNTYKEVSSVSNCTDFQARRGAIRFRHSAAEKPQLVYTLNGSSLALPRLMVALMEHYQQEDGSVAIPDVLKKYGVWM